MTGRSLERVFSTIALYLAGILLAHSEPIVSVQIVAVELPANLPGFASKGSAAIGRTSRLLTDGELTKLVMPKLSSARVKAKARRGDFFDLWDLAEKAGAGGLRPALALCFSQDAPNEGDAGILCGSCDGIIIYCDGRAIFGVSGERDHNESENGFSFHLSKGPHEFCVLCFKAHGWERVPLDHFRDEWSFDLEFFKSSSEAWESYKTINFHSLDTPVVKNWSDLRVSATLPPGRAITVWNKDGEEINHGVAQVGGAIFWESIFPDDPVPFVGILGVGNAFAEGIVLFKDQSPDLVATSIIAAQRELHSADLERSQLLLKTAEGRDRWWARKLALELCRLQCVANPRNNVRWPSNEIHFREYISHIDNTPQFYREFHIGTNQPVAVIIPGVPRPVRPHLESYSVADLKEEEQLAMAAQAAGVALLWPGNVDVDYGGFLTRCEVRECLEDAADKFKPQFSSERLYLIGTCSAGISAIGYADTYRDISGIVLWSPDVRRAHFKWLPALNSLQFNVPSSVMQPERTDDASIFPKSVSVKLLFDINVEGHGDRLGAMNFAEGLKTEGVSVAASFLADPDRQMEFGLRALAGEREWLDWIKNENEHAASKRAASAERQSETDTIKGLLLSRGVSTEKAPEQIFSRWLDFWTKQKAHYRGRPDHPLATEDGLGIIKFREVSCELNQALAKYFADGRPQLKIPSPNEAAVFWGVHLQQSQAGQHVEIITNATEGEPPRLDLLVDCPFRGGLWILRDGKWILQQIWL